MRSVFVSLNTRLERRRPLVLVLLFLVLAALGYFVSGVKIEENLDAIVPSDERISEIAGLFKDSEISDQLVFIVALEDSSRTDPDLLMEKAALLAAALEADSLVKRLSFLSTKSAMLDLYDFFYRNLPLFLDSSDYVRIAGRLGPEAIEHSMKKNFRAIQSPAGMATARFIQKDPLSLTPLVLEKMERFRMDDNFITYNSGIYTRDLKQLMLFADPLYPGSNTRMNARLVQNIDSYLEDLEAELEGEGVQISYYGGSAVAVANAQRVKKDVSLTLSIAMAGFFLIFLVYFRRPKIILLMFLPVLVGALVASAVLTFLHGTVSAISLGIGVIFVGITIDYSLHLFTHLRSGEGLRESLRAIGLPVMMSALTTASAFLCLVVIKSEAMKQIGIFAAVAVGISALSVLIITPLFLGEGRRGERLFPGGRGRTLLERFVAVDLHRRKILVALVLALSLLFAFTSGRIRFNGDISTLNYQTGRLDDAEALLESISSVTESAVYLVTRDSTLDAALEKLEGERGLLESCQEEGLSSQISLVSDLMLSRKGQEERIARWNAFWDEAGREELSGLLRESGQRYHFKADAFGEFYALLEGDFNVLSPEDYAPLRELLLDNFISSGPEQSSVISIMKVKTGGKDALFDRISGSRAFIIFDNQYFINQFFEVLREDFNKLVRLSMIVVFLILLVFFGRIEIALITFIPIAISWMWTLGLMGLFGIEINVFNIIISTFIFGLGIDYCIFLMNGILANYREGKQNLEAYKLSILLSALTTVAAVGVLIFARHPALRSIALVSIFGISTVVLVAYTLLPLFFNFLVRGRKQRRLEPITLYTFLATLIYFLLFGLSALLTTLLLPLLLLLPLRMRRKKFIVSRLIQGFSGFIVRIGFIMRKRYIGMDRLDLDEPAVLIANHQSQLDLMLMLQHHPRIVVLVNKWVWNNVFYGPLIRFAGYYPVYKGLDHDLQQLKKKVEEGYSILAFPEGRRSPDGEIKRFHQGALGIADMLGLKIKPVLIHGAYDALPKTELFLKPGQITMKALPSFSPRAEHYDELHSYHGQAREITAMYRKAMSELREEVAGTDYYRRRLIARFLYKGPVLEWYLRIKSQMEGHYAFFNAQIPRNAEIADLGCGYGFLSIMLAMVAPERKILGLDYDGMKIATAREAGKGLSGLEFREGDLSADPLPAAGVYILNDVLHYLPPEQQKKVLLSCLEQAGDPGIIILRDADAAQKKGTRWTRFTEWQSTRLFAFNRTAGSLHFVEAGLLLDLAREQGFRVESHKHERLSSNTIHILRRIKQNSKKE